MKRLLVLLVFSPTLALADHCPVLTGTYTCPMQDPDTGEITTILVKITTDDHKYTVVLGDDQPVEFTDGHSVSDMVPASEGVYSLYTRYSCTADKKLEVNYRNAWYHDGRPYEGEVPTFEETMQQFYSLDEQGNLAESTTRQRTQLGRQVGPPKSKFRICAKQQ